MSGIGQQEAALRILDDAFKQYEALTVRDTTERFMVCGNEVMYAITVLLGSLANKSDYRGYVDLIRMVTGSSMTPFDRDAEDKLIDLMISAAVTYTNFDKHTCIDVS